LADQIALSIEVVDFSLAIEYADPYRFVRNSKTREVMGSNSSHAATARSFQQLKSEIIVVS